mmetsp:Transcript_531/g.1433  ORF Transcript_531/g.1433 Transcript_531/m.1433 type:complete len:208 (-) Transcript_531:574-1197(-)
MGPTSAPRLHEKESSPLITSETSSVSKPERSQMASMQGTAHVSVAEPMPTESIANTSSHTFVGSMPAGSHGHGPIRKKEAAEMSIPPVSTAKSPHRLPTQPITGDSKAYDKVAAEKTSPIPPGESAKVSCTNGPKIGSSTDSAIASATSSAVTTQMAGCASTSENVTCSRSSSSPIVSSSSERNTSPPSSASAPALARKGSAKPPAA